jgi:hypothetical protein
MRTFLALGLTPAVWSQYSNTINVANRLQWDANYGYCGETSLLQCGLFFGQYVSQYVFVLNFSCLTLMYVLN